MNWRKVLLYLFCLIPWFLSIFLFRSDAVYYESLTLPFFAPKPFIFGIVWTILYFLIAYSIFLVITVSTSNYRIYLTINYFANQLFTFCFFTLHDLFLSLVDTIIVLISSMYLYVETRSMNKKASYYLVPYILWNVFALILIFFVFIKN